MILGFFLLEAVLALSGLLHAWLTRPISRTILKEGKQRESGKSRDTLRLKDSSLAATRLLEASSHQPDKMAAERCSAVGSTPLLVSVVPALVLRLLPAGQVHLLLR